MTGDSRSGGWAVVTVHKALNIEKKGLVGKADPYVVMEVDILYLVWLTLHSRYVIS